MRIGGICGGRGYLLLFRIVAALLAVLLGVHWHGYGAEVAEQVVDAGGRASGSGVVGVDEGSGVELGVDVVVIVVDVRCDRGGRGVSRGMVDDKETDKKN